MRVNSSWSEHSISSVVKISKYRFLSQSSYAHTSRCRPVHSLLPTPGCLEKNLSFLFGGRTTPEANRSLIAPIADIACERDFFLARPRSVSRVFVVWRGDSWQIKVKAEILSVRVPEAMIVLRN